MNLVQKLNRKEQVTIHAFRHETAFASTIDPEYLKNVPVARQYLLAPTKD